MSSGDFIDANCTICGRRIRSGSGFDGPCWKCIEKNGGVFCTERGLQPAKNSPKMPPVKLPKSIDLNDYSHHTQAMFTEFVRMYGEIKSMGIDPESLYKNWRI